MTEETKFLISKGLVKEGYTDLLLKGEFGEVSLSALLLEYAEAYHDEHDQGNYGRRDY